MQDVVDQILARRAKSAFGPSPTASLTGALLLHLLVAGAALLLPRLTPRPEPLSFIPVEIVPAQALGVRQPATRKREDAPAPVREPPRPEPSPAPEPPRPEAPVLPDKKPESKPDPRPPQPESRTGGQSTARPPQPAADREEPGEPGRLGAPTGNPLGTSAFGSEVAGLDHPDFTYGYYIDQLLSAIDARWERPTLGGEVRAVVSFRIARDGGVTDLRVAESSGYNSFDLAALRAVKNAAPFPPLPRAFRHDSLGVNLIVR
jgi:protein TonB